MSKIMLCLWACLSNFESRSRPWFRASHRLNDIESHSRLLTQSALLVQNNLNLIKNKQA